MNREISGTYPTANLPPQPADNSYSGHVGQNQWHTGANQYHPVSQGSAPFYGVANNDTAYPQQEQQHLQQQQPQPTQYSTQWNNWSTEQNNNPPVCSVPPGTASTLNPQADPWQWAPQGDPQLNCYYGANNEQQQSANWGYTNPQTGYPVWQGSDSTGWQQQQQQQQQPELTPEQQAPTPHWDPQLSHQQPLEAEERGPPVCYAYDTGTPQNAGPNVDYLAGQMEHLNIDQQTVQEIDSTGTSQNHSIEESNQEVPPSFQQVESLPEPTASPSPLTPSPVPQFSEGQEPHDPPLILPRKGSLFQPPVPTSAAPLLTPSLRPPSVVKLERNSPDVSAQEVTSSTHPVAQPPSNSGSESHSPSFKMEDSLLVTQPVVDQSVVQQDPPVDLPENFEKPQPEVSSGPSPRPHPLHLVLHRQHFGDDVEEKCRTTLWENPIDSIPNVTLMLQAKQATPESEDVHSREAEAQLPMPTVLNTPQEEVQRATPELTSLLPGPQNVPVVEDPQPPPPPTTFPVSSNRSSAASSALPSPEKTKSRNSPLHTSHQDSLRRESPPQGDSRWTDERYPADSRYRQDASRTSKDDRDYGRKSPQRKFSYSDQPPDSRHFRPGYYPPQSGNYSSRPSSRASEPLADNYYGYERERTPSRMSEVIDDRRYDSKRNRDLDYSRHKPDGPRDSDHRQRGYDDPRYPEYRSRGYDDGRDSDHRQRNYGETRESDQRLRSHDDPRNVDHRPRSYDDPRDSDHRTRGYEDSRGSYEDLRRRDGGREYDRRDAYDRDRTIRGDYGDSNVDYDHQRSSYSDRHYSRSRREDDYYSRPMSKGYDYYSGWQDPVAMYYQYYRNYQANNYGSRNNYGYYRELYETDPKYRQQVDQYNAYINAHRSQMGYDSDQHSLHSGRSSVNDELRKDREDPIHDYTDSSLGESIIQPTPPPRMDPAKFPCAHPIGRLHPGRIVTVFPSHSTSIVCPVNIYDIQHSFHYDPCLKDLKDFPGPLISGQTHKKDVMAFCQQRVLDLQTTREQVVDRSSQILMWELLSLLIRQNGNVIGSDIAELLLKDMHGSSAAQTPTTIHTAGTSPLDMLGEELRDRPSEGSSSNNPADASPASTPSPDEGIVVSQDRTLLNKELSIHQVTHKFTEYLLYGNKKDALEWAVRHNLWGHALFLAYRMGAHNHANLMTRFANSLPLNDPLQTLYQLMSGRQPVAVTSVADEKWGDWRPHLAMILSNPTVNSHVDQKSIITLGDTLAQKGCLSAAHFCYLMAQVEFGTFENKSSKLVLLGADHTLPFEKFATNEAIHLTEIYEYAVSLANPNYIQPKLQPYKFLYATRLADYGLIKEALHYCEVMSSMMLTIPNNVSSSLFKNVYQLATQLKYQDPHYTQGTGELEELGDPPWLSKLQLHCQQIQGSRGESLVDSAPLQNQGEQSSISQSYYDPVPGSTTMYSSLQGYYSQDPNQTGVHTNYEQHTQQQAPAEDQTATTPSTLEQIPMLNVGNETWSNYTNNYSYVQGSVDTLTDPEQVHQVQWQEMQHKETEDHAEQNTSSTSYYDQISSSTPTYSPVQGPPLQGSSNLYGRQRQDSVASSSSRKGSNSSTVSAQPGSLGALSREEEGGTLQTNQLPGKTNQQNKQDASKKQDPSKQQVAGTGWLGTFINKILPKGPNQMILPDDKAPKIIWDEKKKMWVDLDGNNDDVVNANMPPPKDSDLITSMQSPGSSFSPMSSPPSGDHNRFQRPKHRGMRQNYVDILNSNNANRGSQGSLTSAPETLFPRMETNTAAPPAFFVPPPVPVTDNAPADVLMTANSDNYSLDRSTYKPDNELGPSPLLNPADFNMTANNNNNLEAMHKPPAGRLGGRRAYPS